MPISFFQALASASSAVLTPELNLLQSAGKSGFTIASTHVSRPAAFAHLVEENQLFATLRGMNSQDEAFKAKLFKKIANLHIPIPLSHELHQLYHKELGVGFVRIQCWTQYGVTPWISEIKGDVNIAESLLLAWSAAIDLNFQHGASLVEAVTNCQAIIQFQPSAPVACGEVFTRHPESGERHLLVLRLWPGAPHGTMHKDVPTQYAVDIRTGLIVQHQVGVSTQRAKRQPDKMIVERQTEIVEFPEEEEILDVVRQMNAFKRQFPHHVYATFEIAGTELILTSIAAQREERSPIRQTTQLMTQVYVATGRSDSLDITRHENCDGIGLLRGEYVFSRLEIHPLQLLKRNRLETITDQLTTVFTETNQSYPDRRVVYRLQNFTSQELRSFKAGETQEKEEPNPYLGWRGGLRLIEQPELFEPELSAFTKWLKRRHAPTGLIVPFVRSTAEWRWIINRWKERQFFDHPEFENWFQITTPENVTNLENYVMPEVYGLSLNLRTVTALMSGVDPDDAQLLASYPPPIELQQSILEEVSRRVAAIREQGHHSKLKLNLHVEDFNNALVTSAVKLRYDGIILQPEALLIGRSCIGAAEQL